MNDDLLTYLKSNLVFRGVNQYLCIIGVLIFIEMHCMV
jgi:hypothetical protein